MSTDDRLAALREDAVWLATMLELEREPEAIDLIEEQLTAAYRIGVEECAQDGCHERRNARDPFCLLHGLQMRVSLNHRVRKQERLRREALGREVDDAAE